MSDPTYTPGLFVWRELMTPEVERAKAFYAALFGWTFETAPMAQGGAYHLIKVGERSAGGIMAPPMEGMPSMWCSYASVPDVDAAVARASELGGNVVAPPMEIPGVGRFAVIEEPAGAVFEVIRFERGDPPLAHPPPLGAFCWETCVSPGGQGTAEFFGAVLGWRDGQPPGPGIRVLESGGTLVCDLMAPPEGVPPHFLTYVLVADLGAARERVTALGGQVEVSSVAIPNVGTMAIIVDPVGARIALFQPKMG